MSTTLKFKY